MAQTIFGLGDFNKLNLGNSESLNDPDKQRDFFNSTMADICGNTSTSGADYFKGLSQVHEHRRGAQRADDQNRRQCRRGRSREAEY